MLDITQILNGLDSYRFSTEEELDNVESLSYFIDEILDIGDFKFVCDDGTFVILEHEGIEVHMSSGGLGDFNSHIINFKLYKGGEEWKK